MQLTERQLKIVAIVKEEQPVSSKKIAKIMNTHKTTIRLDLSLLTMLNLLVAKPKLGYFYNKNNYNLINMEKLLNTSVKDIMSQPVKINEEMNINEAIITMFLEDVGTIYAVDNNDCLSGVISRKDLLKMTIGKSDLINTPVSLAMTRMPNIITITLKENYFEAAKKIALNKIDSLPVINKKYKILGRVTKTSITTFLVDFINKGSA